MTTKTATLNSKTSKGQNVRMVISVTRDVVNNTSYADGWNLDMGRKIIEHTQIEVYIDGKYFSRYSSPERMNASPERKEEISKIIAGLYAEIGETKEYQDLKAAEVAKQKQAEENLERMTRERIARNAHPGWCNKCHSYCYGDCEA